MDGKEQTHEYLDFIDKFFPIKWGNINEIETKLKLLVEEGIDDDNVTMIGESKEDAGGAGLVSYGDNQHMKMLVKDGHYKVAIARGIILLNTRSIDIEKEKIEVLMQELRNKTKGQLIDLRYSILDMENKCREMSRLVTTIEIFSGVTEEITTIKEGKASEETKVNIYQRKLYMDEEVGIYAESGGMTFRDIKEFDVWVSDNIDVLMASEIGVLIMSTRRTYAVSSFSKETVIGDSIKDTHSYIIIRNGENIYRIFTDKIQKSDRFFPIESEFNKILNSIAENEENIRENIDRYNVIDGNSKILDNKDQLFNYVRNFLLIQGIIVRTDIFDFIPKSFNIFNMDDKEAFVNYIYDDESSRLIGDGLPTFKSWISDMNSSIRRGKQIVMFLTEFGGLEKYHYQSRFLIDLNDMDRIYPPDGIYTIKSEVVKDTGRITKWIKQSDYVKNPKEFNVVGYQANKKVHDGEIFIEVYDMSEDGLIITEEEKFYITFQQTDKLERYYTSWLRFEIKPTDDFWISYEDIPDETLDYYLTSREARRHYLSVLPLLNKFKTIKQGDKEIENFYKDIVLSKISEMALDIKLKRDALDKAIYEWRYGNTVTVNSFINLKNGSVEETKAVKFLEQETKRIIKSTHGISYGVNIFAPDKILTVKLRGLVFYGRYITKKDFVKRIKDEYSFMPSLNKIGVECEVITEEMYEELNNSKFPNRVDDESIFFTYNNIG